MDEKSLLKEGIEQALDKLYSRDSLIIHRNKNNHTGERSIVFRFGMYFDEYCREYFLDYDVDEEYNRNLDSVKKLNDDSVIPDLILHKRNSNKANLLVIEFKTWWNKDQTKDKNKIKGFIDPNGMYHYKYGAVILVGKTREECEIEWIQV